ncbi:hypothetical protein NHH03_13580 [Stieleria sp. TO1_6]|uniref:hypothetical protein n=1 Tax=Stieleria tagensis TaxID=2956795 RepID=UPI00209B5C39|nr:hypothetical protein [Stieleria tagensis]MCO8122773.1 hypothetical protein [Stieleria tagensis]
MKNCDFTLELADGTVVAVGSMSNARHPDIKAFFLPAASMMPFSSKNLPTARRSEETAESVLTRAF